MTEATRREGPAPEGAWSALAERTRGLDPGETLTTRVYERAAGEVMRARAAPGRAARSPLAEVPRIELLAEGTRSAEGAELEIRGVLGEGGMGKVLLARQRSLQREVAVKVLRNEATSTALESLVSEAVVTGSIEHPNVVPIHALGHDAAGRPLLVMKRIEGVSWRELARDPAHPAWASIAADDGDRTDVHLEVLMAVCNAAHFAHSRGFIHRDIKPANVMIGSFGEVYLCDWGIATGPGVACEDDDRDGMPIGTPSYMAPEMVSGNPAHVDARTDVYLLGATLHAVLTGRPRHQGESIVDVLISARDSLPFTYGPDVPAELAALCNQAMSVDPGKRFATALDMRRAICAYRKHRGSIVLADQAAARLAEIDSLLASGPPSPEDERRVHALMTECRFGFLQALDAWKGNREASAGLCRCLEHMIDHEIAQKDARGARALLAELAERGGPRPNLAARVEALEAALREGRAREEQLRAMQRDLDLSIGARTQLAILAGLPLVGAGVFAFIGREGTPAPDRRSLLLGPVVHALFLIIGFAIARRHLGTAVSRRAFALLLLAPAGTGLHRLLLVSGQTPLASIWTGDLIVAAVVSAAMSITVLPRALWVTALCVAAAIVAALRPESAFLVFSVTSPTAFALLLFVWWRSVRA